MALDQRHNICRATDAYKITQVGIDPTGVQFIMEYMTARGDGLHARVRYNEPRTHW